MVSGDREIGELTGRLAAVERTTERLERKLDQNSATTSEILNRIASMDGGWKTLSIIGAIAAVIGGLIVRFLPSLFHV